MKTSNRLLLGTIAMLVFYVTVAFIELRIKGDYNRRTFNTDSVALPMYHHLVIEGLDQRVYIKPSESPMITTRTVRENPMAALDYALNGDTLIIHDLGLQSNDQGQFTIYSGAQLKSLTSVDSYFQLGEYEVDSLVIDQQGGRGSIYDMSGLDHLGLSVKRNAEFDVYNARAGSVNLIIDHGNVEFRSPIISLRGSMKHNSYLSLQGVQNFAFKKDDSSRLRIFE